MRSLLTRRSVGLAAFTLFTLASLDASARSKKPAKEDDDESSEVSSKDEKKKSDDADAKDGDADEKDESSEAKKKPAKKDDTSSSSTFEEEGQDYWFVGARYRHTILPKFIVNMFVDGGPTVVSIPGFGLEASKRRDGFEMVAALTYQNWSMDEFPFKGKNESEMAWEKVESRLKMFNATADFLWSSKISGNELQFLYGLTAGIGFVWGDLYHAQAHPNGTGAGDPSTYVPCQQSDFTSGPYANGYCNKGDNFRYAGYTEPSWANGGYKPLIYPTFGLQLGMRWKPAKEFVARLDAGYNLFSGFFFGLGLDYGLPPTKAKS
jgi:hypothetical protein